MKISEHQKAILLRAEGKSIGEIASILRVAKSSVSTWVRDVEISEELQLKLKENTYSLQTVERRRTSRLKNELVKRNLVINNAGEDIGKISLKELHLIGVMLYQAEGGKTRRLVRFSNGDPEMIRIMMAFFRRVCNVPEEKFRGHIHIHDHLDEQAAQEYWARVSSIRARQFFKSYKRVTPLPHPYKNSLPYGVFDIYVLDTNLFYKLTGWSRAIFRSY